MFDPYAEKAFDAHSAALLRALPMALLNWMARQMSQSHTVLGDSVKTLYTPGEMNGLSTLSETQRND